MISYLKIKNFALIDELDIEFEKGLNVITGETGAGKSMIIEAIQIILGNTASSHLIKSDADSLEVEALFHLEGISINELWEIPEICDILTDSQQLVIRREIHRKKKSQCWVNHHLVTLSLLQKLGNYLVDLHGQHSHQLLLDPESHIEFVDNLGGPEFLQKKKQLKDYFFEWQLKTRTMNQLLQERAENLSKKDYLVFQFREINAAELKEGEDQEIEEKVNIIRNMVKIKEIMEMAVLSLYEGGAEGEISLRDTLTNIIHQFNMIAGLDQDIRKIQEQLDEVRFKVEDISDQVVRYKDKIDFDAQQLNELEDRLTLINHLKQKYGTRIAEIITYKDMLEENINSIEDGQMKIETLKLERNMDEQKIAQLSYELSEERKKISQKIEKEILKELKELNMKEGHFVIRILQKEDQSGVKINGQPYKVTPKGIDRIEFFISTNAGEPEKALAEIVSGGEVSRIMLALKSILGEADRIPTMIFDEIDSGVGARLGEVVANKLSKISRNHQVIAVTHLPQIACHADQHLYIQKCSRGNQTMIEVRKLAGNEQVEEIARMLDGDKYGSISIEHAKEMLFRKDV